MGGRVTTKPKNHSSKKTITFHLAVVAIAVISGCASDKASQTTTTTSQETTLRSLVTTTTPDVKTK